MLQGLDDREQTVAAAETISSRFPDLNLIVMTDDEPELPSPTGDGSRSIGHLLNSVSADQLVQAALSALHAQSVEYAHGIYPDAL